MSDIRVEWADQHRGKPAAEHNTIVDQEMERFSQFMAGLQDDRARGPLADFEKALVKSYLVAKLTGKIP